MSRLKVKDLSFCRVLKKNDVDVKGGFNKILKQNYFLFQTNWLRLINNKSIVSKQQLVTITTLASTVNIGVVTGKNFISSFASSTSISTRK